MTIAHTGIVVPRAIHADVVAWYLKALEPLGYKKIVDIGVAVGLGDKEFEPDWWIIGGDPPAGATSHTAFASPGKPTRHRAHPIGMFQATLLISAKTGPRWRPSTKRLSMPGARITGRRVSGRSTTPTTMPRL
ncbi:hypothetical protein IMZ48_06420 [Candidatus Bathyarchaeota archaeon]|nr:hypothetical protein [Candidatus Bathyarchaeota archaeon]